MTDGWNPTQYEKFAAERAQPFWDLAELLDDRPVRRMVDLGCGTGELTAALAGRLGAADVTGIDSSPAMLEAASCPRRTGPAVRAGRHQVLDVRRRRGPRCLQRRTAVDARPRRRRLALVGGAHAGGQLAVQIPSNADHPSHRVAGQVAGEEPYRSAIGTVPPDQVAANVLAPEQYAILLHHLGAARQHVRLQVYGHELGSTADVVEWVRGTTLTRFSTRLPPALFEQFVGEYRRRLLEALGDRSPYFYPFKRILFWAEKASGG